MNSREWVQILNVLKENGFKAYPVGGYVRDRILKREPKDIDFTTDATPTEVVKLMEAVEGFEVIDVGINFGTVGVKINGTVYEVTTFRADTYRDGSRHPSVVYSKTLKDDLERRDFTMNALVLDVDEEGDEVELIDMFNGVQDLEDGIIRFIGVPKRRIKEDPLRILRALRFKARYGFAIHIDSLKAMKHNIGELSILSAERVSKELRGILTGTYANTAARDAYRVGLVQFLTNSIELKHRLTMVSDMPYQFEANMVLMLGFDLSHEEFEELLTLLKVSNNEKKLCLMFQEAIKPYKVVTDVKETIKLFNKDIEKLETFVYLYGVCTGKDQALLWSFIETVIDDPILMSELAVNGNDLKPLMTDVSKTGRLLKLLLGAVHQYPDYNNKEDLLDLVVTGRLPR